MIVVVAECGMAVTRCVAVGILPSIAVMWLSITVTTSHDGAVMCHCCDRLLCHCNTV